MPIVTNFNELKRLRDAALVGGTGSRAWIDFAVTMCDSFPALYDTAQRMNERVNAAEAKASQIVLTAFERLSATGEECELNDWTWMAFPLDEWNAFEEAVTCAGSAAVAPVTPWINPNDKSQVKFLPHIGEEVLFCHEGKTYYGKHTGGAFVAGRGVTAQYFDTWDCLWMPLPAAYSTSKKD